VSKATKIAQVTPVTHHKPHFDELNAIEVVARFGTSENRGMGTTPIETIDAGLSSSPKENGNESKKPRIVFGARGGWADEHGKGDGISSLSLVVERYGLSKNKGLGPIVDYANRADGRPNDPPFALARLIKDLHSFGAPLEEVRAINHRWFTSLYDWFMGVVVHTSSTITFKQILFDWYLEGFGSKLESEPSCSFGDILQAVNSQKELTKRQFGEVREIEFFVDHVLPQTGPTPFNVAGIVDCMKVEGIADRQIIADVRYILNAKVWVQQQFMSAEAEFRKQAQAGAYLNDCPLRVVAIRSDNEQMNRAARSVDSELAVIVQLRSTGHVQIFSNHIKCRRDLRPIFARLRDMEYRRCGNRGYLSRDQLCSGGTLPEVRAWFGFEKFGAIIGIFNSSLTTTDVPPTRLTMSEILWCVREGLKATHRARGVQRDQREKSEQVALAIEA